ncbi:MAG: hypothetical protein ABH864_03765 [archaeon]
MERRSLWYGVADGVLTAGLVVCALGAYAVERVVDFVRGTDEPVRDEDD